MKERILELPEWAGKIKFIEKDDGIELLFISKYKEGDFVVNQNNAILIVKDINEYNEVCDHAYLYKQKNGNTELYISNIMSDYSILRYATKEEKQLLIDALKEVGKRWNAEKKCIEDIPKRKFKKGDRVRIKHGVSSETHYNISPTFVEEMNDLIGKTMTVDRYTYGNNYVECEGIDSVFLEDWLEPYVEELKKGDLAIFWDKSREYSYIRLYNGCKEGMHRDSRGNVWKNAIKFESKEQFEVHIGYVAE